jgi:hypothetical protein
MIAGSWLIENFGCEYMRDSFKTWLAVMVFCCIFSLLSIPATAATTQLHIVKYASDNVTMLNQTTITWQEMERNLPVQGDGIVHYYHQGPVFIDDPDPVKEEQLRWNAAEDTNVKEKDMGAVKGTDLKDLCELAGGMSPGDVVKIKADDGFVKTFAYENVYTPAARQGPMVITWFQAGEGYVPQYRTGMRLVFFADNSTNPWGIHAFGNNDWHETALPEYWYYYQQGEEKYPTTTGLSVQYVSDVQIFSRSTVQAETPRPAPTTSAAVPTRAGVSPFTIVCSLAACGILGPVLQREE